MNSQLLHSLESHVALVLLVWAGFAGISHALRWRTYNLRWKFAFVAFSVAVATVPVGGITLARVVAGCGFVPSIPLLAVLADVAVHDLRWKSWLATSGRAAAWWWGTLAGLALFPSALGLGRFDAYGYGWGFSALCVVVAGVAAGLLWRGNRFGIVLVVATAAWQGGLLESSNYWDYLVDPVYFAASTLVVVVGLVRRRRRPTVASQEVPAGTPQSQNRRVNSP